MPVESLMPQQLKTQQNYVGIWQYIPKNAFLYFPQGQEIIKGSGERQWRKIFQGSQSHQYSTFQQNALLKLQEKLLVSNITAHQWFDKANKLRFLQANKWNVTPTTQAINEYSKYRLSQFPLKESHDVIAMITKGTVYFCGRDKCYRPIIVVDINKFTKNEADLIAPTLVYIMEFMINQLLIEGQVENYVLLMNLQSFSMTSQFGLVRKILSFTSNSYRGRLFACYILGAPWTVKTGFNKLASPFMSQNTLQKIKVTGDLYHQDMWKHIDKDIVQHKYGGKCDNMTTYFPFSQQKLAYQSKDHDHKLLTVSQYSQKFQNAELQNRKIYKFYLRRKSMTINALNVSKLEPQEVDPQIQTKKILQGIDFESLTDTTILVQSSIFPQDLKSIHTFFMGEKYFKIR